MAIHHALLKPDSSDARWVTRVDCRTVERICGWINLVKRMNVNVTPDVVAMYLLATGQGEALTAIITREPHPFSLAGEEEFPETDRLCNGTLMFWRGEATGFSEIPQEALVMARRYLTNRIVRFTRLIADTVRTLSDSFCGNCTIGMRIPNGVANTLKGFTCTMSDINTMENSIASLHAAIFPESVERIGFNRDRESLAWDASRERVRYYGKNDDRQYSDVDVTISNKLRLVNRIADRIRWHLEERVTEGNDVYTRDFERFAEAMEVLLYVACLCQGNGSELGMNLKRKHELNQLRFVDEVNGRREIFQDKDSRGVEYNATAMQFIMCHVSPAAAICVTDACLAFRPTISPRYNPLSMGYIITRDLFEYIRHVHPSLDPDVVTFILNEDQHQKETMHKFEARLNNKPNHDGRIYGCCDECAG